MVTIQRRFPGRDLGTGPGPTGKYGNATLFRTTSTRGVLVVLLLLQLLRLLLLLGLFIFFSAAPQQIQGTTSFPRSYHG